MSLVKQIRTSLAVNKNDNIPAITLRPNSYRGLVSDPLYFFGNDGQEYAFRYIDRNSCTLAYEQCPALTSIINRKAQAYINGKTQVLNSRGKESATPEAAKLRKLMARPNILQSWKQFEAQQQIYIQLFGFSVLLPIVPVGFERSGPIEATSMWNIPPYMLSIQENNKLFYAAKPSEIIDRMTLTYKGTPIDLDVDQLYIFKDITPNFNTLLFPESRVQSLQMPINNIIGALESRNVLINYRGALGIFSRELGSGPYGDVPLEPTDKEQLQSDFRRYGLKNNQWKFIITAAALKWQQIGIPTKDLMLIEEVQEASKMICDGYNYPPHLMGLIDPTFNNQDAAMKGLYENTIIPEAESCYEQWNQLFRTAEYNITLYKDYKHLNILQDDESEAATARYTRDQALKIEYEAGLITLNQWLEAQGLEQLGTDGDVRASDVAKRDIPLAISLGVGGLQGMIEVLTASGLSDESRQAVLEITFGLKPDDAKRMTAGNSEAQAAANPPPPGATPSNPNAPTNTETDDE